MASKIDIQTKFKFDTNFFKGGKTKQPLISFSDKIKGIAIIENRGDCDIFVYKNGSKTTQIHPNEKGKIESDEIKSISIRCEPTLGKTCKGKFKFEGL